MSDEELSRHFDQLQQSMQAMQRSMLAIEQRTQAIEQRMQGIEQRMQGIEQRTQAVEQHTEGMEERLIEHMRDMQTELLRGFEAFSAAQTIRLRKVEADQSNLDAAISGRVDILEKRLTQIELRLGLV